MKDLTFMISLTQEKDWDGKAPMHPSSYYVVKALPSITARCCKFFRFQNHAFSLVFPLVCVIEGVFWICPLLLVCIPLPCLKAPKRWFRRELGSGEASAHPECKGKGILR